MPGIPDNLDTGIQIQYSNRLFESKVSACATSPLSLQTTLVGFFLARRERSEQRAERARALARRRVLFPLLSG
jgi:hypothetical protein